MPGPNVSVIQRFHCIFYLIGILENEVFAGLVFSGEPLEDVHYCLEDTPGVANIESRHLSQFDWFNLLYTQDLVVGRVLGVLPRYISRGG